MGLFKRAKQLRRVPLADVFHEVLESRQLPLPGFTVPEPRGLTRPERDAIDELYRGPFRLDPQQVEGFADQAHRAYRERKVPLAWIHHEQLARALGLVVLRDPTAPCAILTGSLVRIPPFTGPREFRQLARHECGEHLLRNEDATHPDVRAVTIALAIERGDVVSAVRAHGPAGAVRGLARVHRHVPWWEIRARVALAEAWAPW